MIILHEKSLNYSLVDHHCIVITKPGVLCREPRTLRKKKHESETSLCSSTGSAWTSWSGHSWWEPWPPGGECARLPQYYFHASNTETLMEQAWVELCQAQLTLFGSKDKCYLGKYDKEKYTNKNALWSNLVGYFHWWVIFKKNSYTVSIYFLVRRKCTCDRLVPSKFPKLDLWYKNLHNFWTIGRILEIQRAK